MPSCPRMAGGGGGFRGPPLPLLLVPVVVQLVRASADPKMTAFLRDVARGGPAAVAENAHKMAQYALSRVPSDVLYWFASKVLNLPPEVAVQTTEFLKSRAQLEALPEQAPLRIESESASASAALVPADIERRLERLELEYQMLQDKQNESVKMLTMDFPVSKACRAERTITDTREQRELPLPQEHATPQQIDLGPESMQLIRLEDTPAAAAATATQRAPDGQALLQDVGLRKPASPSSVLVAVN